MTHVHEIVRESEDQVQVNCTAGSRFPGEIALLPQTCTCRVAMQVLADWNRPLWYLTYDHGDNSCYEFALKIFEFAGMKVEVTSVSCGTCLQ